MRHAIIPTLVVLAACAPQPVPISPAPPERTPPLPPLCAADLSGWSITHDTLFVPAEISTRAVRPAVLELQQHLCDCLSRSDDRPASLKFVFVASPSEGRTEVQPGLADALSACVGTFVVTYPPFDFNGDLIECDPDDPSKCTSQPASFIMPLELAL
jgi:hypothetical protein